MLPIQIAHQRLHNQRISESTFTTAENVVSYLGAMQAQDFSMVRMAVAKRMVSASEADIFAALNEGKILRTHVLRPTWHLVSAQDIGWMISLTAPAVKQLNKSRNRELELTTEVLLKSFDIITRNMVGGIHLSREQITPLLHAEGIRTDENRLSHILMEAELEALICSGQVKGNKQSYALLSERVTVGRELSQEESLAELAIRYFTAHSPATLRDFCWWSGLSVALANKALASVISMLSLIKSGDETLYTAMNEISATESESVHLLPAFDEYLISYRDRSAALTPGLSKTVISVNGLFYPTVILNSQVAGTWRRKTEKNQVEVEITMLRPIRKKEQALLMAEVEKYGLFLGKKTVIKLV